MSAAKRRLSGPARITQCYLPPGRGDIPAILGVERRRRRRAGPSADAVVCCDVAAVAYPCRAPLYSCRNDRCVLMEWVLNGIDECLDGSDEGMTTALHTGVCSFCAVAAAVPPRPRGGTACFSRRALCHGVQLCDRL